MNTRAHHHSKHQIYPKRYFDASPTWFQWNKLTATQIHSLREERGFEGQNVYFHLNHPIQFVRIVGLIVDIEIRSNKFILITIDDSSGACIEVKTELRSIAQDDQVEYPSNTAVDSLDVILTWGVPNLLINKAQADIGTVVKFKGTIDKFRNIRQLKLERAWVVKDTNEEAKAWSEAAKWHRDVLSKPWVLSDRKRKEIDEKINQDAIKERERARKKRQHDLQYAEKKRKHQEKVEAHRKKQELEYNAGALLGSHILPDRVTDG